MRRDELSGDERVRSLADVAARARARGLHCAVEGERVIASGSVDGAPSVAAVTWSAARGVVLFTCAAPVKVTPANREALVAVVAELNATLAVLGLVVRDAGVHFTAHAYLDADGALSAHVFERSLDLVFAGMSQHRQRLKAVAKGDGPAMPAR